MAKNETGLTGNFHIEINDDETEVFLVFISGSEVDKPWTISDVAELFQARGLAGFKPEETAKQLENFQKKKDKQFRLSIMSSNPAIAPIPETLLLGELPVPDAWKDAVKKALSEAPPPDIFVEIQDKVEKEQTVVKKGSLPFLGSKEETVKVVEKITRQERLAIDPTVLGTCFAVANLQIGTITPAKPGQAGKTVTGELIPARILPDTKFHHGHNVTRKGAELLACITGIVRYGKNWMDLVHFADHNWELELSADKATCYLNFTPGTKYLPAPDAKGILAATQPQGFKTEELIPEAELQALISEAIDVQQPFHQVISLSQDSFFEIIISEDKLKAVLNAVKGSGSGKPLTLKDMGSAINKSGLKFNKDKIKADLPAWFNGQEKVLVAYVLAEGQAPKEVPRQGASYGATFLEGKDYENLKKELLSSPLSNLAAFPKEKITGIAKVDREQRVMTLGPQTIGPPGMDVFGVAIPGIPATPFALELSGFLEMAGPILVVAKRNGLLIRAEDQSKTYLSCLEHLDAEIIIELADGDMTAFITINAHRGSGKPLKRVDIMAEIAKLGIKKGIETEILDKIIQSSESEIDVQHACFARGKAPEAGSPSQLRYLIEFASGQGVTMRKDGTADFRNQDKITKVKKGTVIAEILPSDHIAMPGWDILGKDIPAPVVAQTAVEIGANIRQQTESDGRTLLIADQDGELKREKNHLEIASAFNIKGNIDATTGNIKFPGAVLVTGDVMTGFYIMAGGEIKIAGSIEGALLSTDEDITIMAGVKGAGKAMIRTKKNVMTSFIEQATVMAIGDIKVNRLGACSCKPYWQENNCAQYHNQR